MITLSAVDKLLAFEASRVLVIAPLLPAKETWPAEIRKWDHLQGLTYAVAIGPADQRIVALQEHADVTIINRENVVWLVDQYKKHWPFDTVVIDELSSFKNPSSKRFRALRKVRQRIRRIVGLTGTPAPNGLLDLWSEIYLLDQGESLGRTLTSYREAYFQPDRWGPGGVIYDYKLREGAEEKIYQAIAPICISMASAGDLPEMVSVDRDVILAPEELDEYNRMQKDMLLPLADGAEIDAQSAAVLSGKLLQMAGGAVYDAEGVAHERHQRKLEALEQLVEEANGQSVLVFYNYKHERTRIRSCSLGRGTSRRTEPSRTGTRERSRSSSRTPQARGTGSTCSSAATSSCGSRRHGIWNTTNKRTNGCTGAATRSRSSCST